MKYKKFTNDLANYQRFKTRVVQLRHFDLGGENFIRLQSMTNTDTQDIDATVNQASRIIEQGADYVRITTPTIKDVEALDAIRHRLRVLYETPLIADIHFSPKVAMAALDIVEKIRINPGNFVDRPRGKEYDDKAYRRELEKIEEQFKPLLLKAKKNHRVIRIGTNIGSLAERILQKYGSTAQGMVTATMEYIEIARKYGFDDIVISLKASNPKVNVWANRLLVATFLEKGYDYPIHLGVTEAGNGLEGRIKSAVGIGALLIDGIGDTVRVSLTEPPENEIPVARKIVNYATARARAEKLPVLDKLFFNPYDYEPRKIKFKNAWNKPVVIVEAGAAYEEFDGLVKPDYIVVKNPALIETYQKAGLQVVSPLEGDGVTPLFTVEQFLENKQTGAFVVMKFLDLKNRNLIRKLKKSDDTIIVFEPDSDNITGQTRHFIYELIRKEIQLPVVLKLAYNDRDIEDTAIKAAIDSGVFFIDGLVNGLWLRNDNFSAKDLSEISLNILQASGSRYFKAEIIACPSCGRATFDVEEVTNLVKSRLGHLSGVKIAVMGCIVNGLGEMADADFGYVGTGKGLVSLYKGRELVEKNLPQEKALERLEQLISEYQKE